MTKTAMGSHLLLSDRSLLRSLNWYAALCRASAGPRNRIIAVAMTADRPWITLPTTRVGAYRLSIQSRPRCSHTLGSPIAAAPPMSASGLSPTTQAPPRRIRTRWAASAKIRGLGLLTPACSEITQSAT